MCTVSLNTDTGSRSSTANSPLKTVECSFCYLIFNNDLYPGTFLKRRMASVILKSGPFNVIWTAEQVSKQV